MYLSITIKGDVPSKKNSKQLIMAGGRPRIIPGKFYNTWHEEKMWEIKKHVPRSPIEKVDKVIIHFYASTRRQADCTNKAESIMDLMVDAGIIKDDNWFVCPDVHPQFMGVDKNNPRAEVRILY